MTSRKSIIIINPIAGWRNAKQNIERIRKWLRNNKKNCDVVHTNYSGNASEITAKSIENGYNHIIVNGGDGTINEVASIIYKYDNVSLGVIPSGSGNGLALHLGIPIQIEKSLKIAFGDKKQLIDVGLLNNKPFFSVAGVGFDAFVAEKFSRMRGRGLKNYIKAVIQNYQNFEPLDFLITHKNGILTQKALMVSLANSNQFGNNATFSPQASLSDGLIDICVMQKIPLPLAVAISPMFLAKKINKTHYLEIIQTDQAKIQVKQATFYHIDGEPYKLENESIEVSVLRKKLLIHTNLQ